MKAAEGKRIIEMIKSEATRIKARAEAEAKEKAEREAATRSK